jgi:hypothetical protein
MAPVYYICSHPSTTFVAILANGPVVDEHFAMAMLRGRQGFPNALR